MIKKMKNSRWRNLDYTWARLDVFQALVFFTILCGTLGDTSIRLPRHTNPYIQNSYKNISNIDNHKPVIKNCASYQPHINEEQRAGTFVIKVEAEDPDPPERGGSIIYSLIMSKSEKLHKNKFEIDPKTGIIRTIAMIDREEPENIKEKFVTVFAVDNGRPKLDDSCTFKITIDDINDNTPLFNRGHYFELIPQDLEALSRVMKVTATDDDDGDNSKIRYRLLPSIATGDDNYFVINENSGVINLKKRIDKEIGYKFELSIMAYDKGTPPRNDTVGVTIEIVESFKKPPSFIDYPTEPIVFNENYHSLETPVAQVTAVSNMADNSELIFSIVAGKTEQTNSANSFGIINANNGTAFIIVITTVLDYERINEYNLTIRVENWYHLAAETIISIQLKDVNDNPPVFDNIRKTWTVLENEPADTTVMQVHATDADATPENNQITYKLGNFKDIFSINKYTGIIKTLVQLDKEAQDRYQLLVYASDNSPSSYKTSNESNIAQTEFFISVADKNDNPPKFNETVYVAKPILENVNENYGVINVYAIDVDTESEIIYSIIDGNEDDSFYVDGSEIRVKKPLDYEKITKYNLTVQAFDGIYYDIATVIIFIENVNDNLPEFEEFDANPQINEEEKVEGCITVVKAYDPDIKDRSVDQNITYEIVKDDQRPYFTIDSSGCLALKKKLNRDPPTGFPTWYVSIAAYDNCGSFNSHHKVTSVNITLNDINDNAPFLNMPEETVWNENQDPGKIVTLIATDYDSDENGPPFNFSIDNDPANNDILDKFYISNGNLFAKVKFDREERKSYDILIKITDSGTPTMTGTSMLTVVIGDVNDNVMQSGNSSIFVYNYEENNAITNIGRVYVNDLDDWDLPDKRFRWLNNPDENFELDEDTGMIKMRPRPYEGTFLLQFRVEEESLMQPLTRVNANVTVTVKTIPKEAVEKSGSIRFFGITAEEFITVDSKGQNKRDELQKYLATLFNTSVNNVDVFTVLHSPVQKNNKNILDVRFSAHGSPYYLPEKLNTLATIYYKDIETKLDTKVMMINIDECLIETKSSSCNDSCQNHLNIDNLHGIYTNKTSFVGVKAIVEPLCICPAEKSLNCLNGGKVINNKCECEAGFEGPLCELLDISFSGHGHAIMSPPKQTCGRSHLSLEILTSTDNGLIFYFGPLNYIKLQGLRDFMSLELKNGYAYVYVDYGSKTIELKQKNIKLNDGKQHKIDIYWLKDLIEMKIDNCDQTHCWSYSVIDNLTELNVNGPLQIGGAKSNFRELKEEIGWDYTPTNIGFAGCIRNLTINNVTYNFQSIGVDFNSHTGCNYGMSRAVTFGIDGRFLISVLSCVAILLVILLGVLIFKRKREDLYKDMDDIRENIINYEDEGGGEVDTGYDLNVLRRIYDPPPIDSKIPENYQSKTQDEIPDICSFLDGKKDSCDKDPDTNPFDDVRHYAYEGEGNSDGSLSSLASCTDDGDLKFNYLSNFGPRFRKLADMYGEEPSDDDSDGVEERESESWC